MSDDRGVSKVPMRSKKPSPRRLSRDFAVRGVFQWLMNHNAPALIDAQSRDQPQFNRVDVDHFKSLLYDSIAQYEQLSGLMTPFLDRAQEQISYVEQAILLVGVCELKNHISVPYRVVINEALDLQKKYGSDEGFRYINGVLDHVAAILRKLEYRQTLDT